ncbi:nucleotide-sugar transporter-domain-containing protein [Dichomitus squalens]|uniref:Nucleotide-sugar transporter-domain-containing protein n=1 Tax=Dichomitus squalens TaxID=114155 RepID=A0A4Q9N5P7_9APHY|nr:nucleotide-sugar transporter-domain-containing protein [Dichomitus squalens]
MSHLKDYTVLPQHVAHLHNHERDPEVGGYEKEQLDNPSDTQQNAAPTICGMPLKYVSLVTLAVQNALLTLIMHYSRVSTAPQHTYSAGSAVLMVELLKGFISLCVAFARLDSLNGASGSSVWNPRVLFYRFRRLGKEVFRPDCWKLSIPAILYVIQNNLQFVAVSNLEAATFQVSYQMKILTTAAFSVVLLRKKLSPTKWLALLFLAIGVGIVQIQNGSPSGHSASKNDMNAFKGFMAVVMACFTSGLAGVYFEMVLKNSQADLWVRNVQLSLFSLLPALVPIICSNSTPSGPAPGWLNQLFANFGVWAWATVLIQVLGGLLTALVIKYADNILKGFATSLSIVISFLASVALFDFQMTVTFILGSTVVLVATWMYNQPDAPAGDNFYPKECRSWNWRWRRTMQPASSALELAGGNIAISRRPSTSSLASVSPPPATGQSRSYPGSPVERDMPSPFFPAHLLEKNLLGKRKEDDPTPFFPVPLRASRAATRLAHYFTRTGSGSFIVPEGSGFAYPPSQAPSTMYASLPPSLSSTRPSSGVSSCTNSRPASAMGSVVSLSLGTLPEQDHHS